MPPSDARETSPYAPWSRAEPRPAQAPPPAPPAEPLESPVRATSPAFGFENAWRLGARIFQRRYGSLTGASAMWVFAWLATSAIQQALAVMLAPPFGQLAAFIVGSVLQLLVLAPIMAGVLMMAAHAARGREIRVANAFAAYARLETIIAITIFTTLLGLAVSLPVVAAVAVLNANPGAAPAILGVLLGGIITLAGYVLILSRLGFAIVVALDPAWLAPGPLESLKLSWRITDRAYWPFLAVWITSALACAFSILMFGIGIVLVGFPLMMAVQGAAYALLVAGERPERCARCGCSLKGLPSRTCPECQTVAPRGD